MSLGLRFPRSLGWSLLLCVVLCVVRTVAEVEGETTSDLVCLKGFQDSLTGKGLDFLRANWTGVDFPCSGNTTFAGLVCSNEQVREISLVRMELEGSISSEIIQCIALSTLDLSDNRMSGPIPPEIGELAQLATLNLSLNNFDGEIPEFTKASYTNVIDLHGNDLTGEIPSSLGYLERLNTFDVSDNDLSGPIPLMLANTSTGARFNASAFEGNRLYGYPLDPPSDHGLSVLAIVGIGLGSGMLSLIVSFTAVCIWLRVTEQRGAAEEGKISQLMPES